MKCFKFCIYDIWLLSTFSQELSATTPSGIASFLFSWSSCSKTLLPTPFYSSSPYFTYAILTIETKLENETGFWNSVMVHLANPKISVEAAVKVGSHFRDLGSIDYKMRGDCQLRFFRFFARLQKACSASKLTTSPNFLAIYRWAQFALELPVDHQLTFLVWQKFFTRFLFRPITGYSTNSLGPSGICHFFNYCTYSSLVPLPIRFDCLFLLLLQGLEPGCGRRRAIL